MTIQVLSDPAKEEATYIITVDFEDEDGDPVVPTSITWTLTDSSGTVINDREDEVVAVPAPSIDIVLSGNDLVVQSGETASKVSRRLLIEAVVDTDAGSNLPIKDEVIFVIENLLAVSYSPGE